jgi:hypothetical protein
MVAKAKGGELNLARTIWGCGRRHSGPEKGEHPGGRIDAKPGL